MLKKIHRLNKEKDIARVSKHGRKAYADILLIKFLSNNLAVSRLGIIISKKVSKKAISRNLAKRRISEIIRLNYKKIKNGFDIIIIVSPKIIQEEKVLRYQLIEKFLLATLGKANLII